MEVGVMVQVESAQSGPLYGFEAELVVTADGPVRVVLLNRPDDLNGVNRPMHQALARVWDHLGADPDARAVVITGAGSAFSAGGDFGYMQENIDDEVLRAQTIEEARSIIRGMVNCPLPVIAAVNGPAVGLGCSIALLSDFLVMGKSSYLADPHVAVGLVAGDGGAAMLPLLIGLMKAKEYVMLGDRITPEEAEKLNLVTKVAADDAVLDDALAIGERLAALPPQALRCTKVAMNMHLSRAALGILEYALAEEYTSFSTPEFQERVAAFRAKKK